MSFKINLMALALVATLASSQAEARKLAPHMAKQVVASVEELKESGKKVSDVLAKVAGQLKAGKEVDEKDLLTALKDLRASGASVGRMKTCPMTRLAHGVRPRAVAPVI